MKLDEQAAREWCERHYPLSREYEVVGTNGWDGHVNGIITGYQLGYRDAERLLEQNIEELKTVHAEIKATLEVYASDSNWYSRTTNNKIEFHDGSDQNLGSDSAKDTLKLITELEKK